MRKKRLLAFFTAMVLLLATLAACQGGTPSASPSESAAAPSPSQDEPEAGTPETDAPETPVAMGSGGQFDDFPRPVLVEGRALRLGFIQTHIEASSAQRKWQQAQIEAAHRGWEVEYVMFENDSEFRDSFQNLMNQNVDAIILDNFSAMDAKADLIAAARQAGIGVYNDDNQVVPGIVCNVTMPNGVGSLELAYRIGEDLGWNANIATVLANGIQVHHERIDPAQGLFDGKCYANFKLVAAEDVLSTQLAPEQAVFQFTQAWLQQYGDDINVIFTPWDGAGIAAAEAIIQAGDATGEKCITSGIDGGSEAWSYIRNNTPFQYCYSQPFELYTHNVFEVIDAIQVKNLSPGEAGCPISFAGETLYARGMVTTRSNCPQVGASIHAVFEYYGQDPDDPDAWYNWDDGPGILTVSE